MGDVDIFQTSDQHAWSFEALDRICRAGHDVVVFTDLTPGPQRHLAVPGEHVDLVNGVTVTTGTWSDLNVRRVELNLPEATIGQAVGLANELSKHATGFDLEIVTFHGAYAEPSGSAAAERLITEVRKFGAPVVLEVEPYQHTNFVQGMFDRAAIIGYTEPEKARPTFSYRVTIPVPEAQAATEFSGFFPVHQTWNYSPTYEFGASTYETGADLNELLSQPISQQAPTAIPARYVNAFVAIRDRDDPVEEAPLALNSAYDMVCNVGISDPRSLLGSEEARFPSDLLPGGPLELRAVLFVEGSGVPAHTVFQMDPGAEASEWVRLPLPVARAVGTIHAELAIYYEVAVVHIQALTIPVGGRANRGGPKARLLYRLSRSFSDLGKLKERQACLVLTDRPTSSAVFVNGLQFAPNAFAADHNAVDTAVKAIREQMYYAHFRVQDNKEVNLFATKGTKRTELHGKPANEFMQDLRILANNGARVFTSLFKDNLVAGTVAELVRGEAAAYDRPPVLQVVDIGSRALPIPWALVYDLPVGGDPARYVPCPSIIEFGPGAAARIPPGRCPHEAEHRDGDRWRPDQLCPWGFWGMSAVIEHPPFVNSRDLEAVVGSGEYPVSVFMADDSGLDENLRRQHIDALDGVLSTSLTRPAISEREDLGRQLANESMDVVYLYCHCGYDKASPSFGFDPYLQLGSAHVTPLDIDQWARTTVWPDPHWPSRHPLVIINGCHTAELVTGSLTSFVEAFTNRAAAAGLVGTEITVDQGVAGWAMELFLTELHRGKSVGQAIREMRWSMFARGNLMGLAYTPYCLAGLTLRPVENDQQGVA